MATLLLHHSSFANHQTAPGHPDAPPIATGWSTVGTRPSRSSTRWSARRPDSPNLDTDRATCTCQPLRRRASKNARPDAAGYVYLDGGDTHDGAVDVGGGATRCRRARCQAGLPGPSSAGSAERLRRLPPAAATTPKPNGRWGFACSTTSVSVPRHAHQRRHGLTAGRDRRFRRPSWQRDAGDLRYSDPSSCTHRRIRCRCFPAPARCAKPAWGQYLQLAALAAGDGGSELT